MYVEEETVKSAEEREKLEAELRDARLNLKLVAVWKEMAIDVDQKAAAAIF